MIFVKEIADLENLLNSAALFSKDPLMIQVSEIDLFDIAATESRINLLKKQSGSAFIAKAMLVALAVISIIIINRPGFHLYQLVELLPLTLGISTLAGIAGLYASRLLRKIKLRHEVKHLLRQIPVVEKKREAVPV